MVSVPKVPLDGAKVTADKEAETDVEELHLKFGTLQSFFFFVALHQLLVGRPYDVR